MKQAALDRRTNKDGTPDKRTIEYKQYLKSQAKPAAVGRVGLALIALDLGLQGYNHIDGFMFSKESKSQMEAIQESWLEVNNAINQGIIDNEFLNMEDLSKVADFLYQGTPIENKRLSEIGTQIRENNSIKVTYP